MKVSIIIPIYNIQDYLEKCVNSILVQTYSELEIILVDDGSTDKSSLICDQFGVMDSRVNVIHKENGGLVSARKCGLARATGEYVLNVDGDDWIEPNAIEVMLYRALEFDADFVQCSFFFETGIQKKEMTFAEKNEVMIDDASEIISQWLCNDNKNQLDSQIFTKLVKTDVFRSAYESVPDNMSNGEDFVCFVELICRARNYTSICDKLYHYVYRDNSLSHQVTLPRLLKEYYLTHYIVALIEEKRLDITNEVTNKWIEQRLILASAGVLNKLYREYIYIPMYVSANIKEFRNKRVVIYGGGVAGNDFYNQATKYKDIQIVLWVDKRYYEISNPFMAVTSIGRITEVMYDVICVAIKNKSVYEQIKMELLEIGVSKNKIIWMEPKAIWEL